MWVGVAVLAAGALIVLAFPFGTQTAADAPAADGALGALAGEAA